ncbi:MAG: ABC transporter ATP-binding protein/permease [Treponema sp.]|nr:ABC transporter ATP-binding protein/permease [Treponema sp.]
MNKKIDTIKKVLKLTHRLQKGHIAIIILNRLLNGAVPFVSIVFSSIILDLLIAQAPFELIMKNALILIGYNCVMPLIYWGLEHVIGVNSACLNEKIDQMICEKSFDIDYDVLERQETLDLIKKAEEGINSYGNITGFCQGFAGLVEMVAKIIYALVLLLPIFIPSSVVTVGFLPHFLNQWYSGIVLLFVLVLEVLVSTITNKKSQGVQKEFFVQNVRANREYGYYFNMMFEYSLGKYIRLYKSQEMVEAKTAATLGRMENEFMKLMKKINRVQLPGFLVQFIVQAVSYIFVGLKAIFGFISVGSALKFITAYANLVGSITSISYQIIDLGIKAEYLSYFYDFMEIENKRYEGTIPTEKRNDNEFEIEFRNVSFKYANSDSYVLKHVNHKIKIGTKTAIVGKNGAGKTTFIKLLCRLYEPTEGQILLNGIDIRYYDYVDYAQLFAVVFQDFNLFSFSIAENVAFNCDYDADRVTECLVKAGLEERIARMKDGIQTNIYQQEENGVEISGGEAQKIAIARALYKDAPLVILDEPTSALDPVSEYEIYKKFDEMVEDKTSVYISHRMSSCRFCDNILVFDDGQIVEQGNHEQLLVKNGLYSKLWNAQAQYYS